MIVDNHPNMTETIYKKGTKLMDVSGDELEVTQAGKDRITIQKAAWYASPHRHTPKHIAGYFKPFDPAIAAQLKAITGAMAQVKEKYRKLQTEELEPLEAQRAEVFAAANVIHE